MSTDADIDAERIILWAEGQITQYKDQLARLKQRAGLYPHLNHHYQSWSVVYSFQQAALERMLEVFKNKSPEKATRERYDYLLAYLNSITTMHVLLYRLSERYPQVNLQALIDQVACDRMSLHKSHRQSPNLPDCPLPMGLQWGSLVMDIDKLISESQPTG